MRLFIPGWKINSFKMSIDRDSYSFALSNGITTFSSSNHGVIYFEKNGSETLALNHARQHLELTARRGWFSSLLVGLQQAGTVSAQTCQYCNIAESGCETCCQCSALECTNTNPPNRSCNYNCGSPNCGWCYTPKLDGGNCCSCLTQLCSCCL